VRDNKDLIFSNFKQIADFHNTWVWGLSDIHWCTWTCGRVTINCCFFINLFLHIFCYGYTYSVVVKYCILCVFMLQLPFMVGQMVMLLIWISHRIVVIVAMVYLDFSQSIQENVWIVPLIRPTLLTHYSNYLFTVIYHSTLYILIYWLYQ
jgi:hypothetical protein